MIIYDGFSGPCCFLATPSFSSGESGSSIPKSSGLLLAARVEPLYLKFSDLKLMFPRVALSLAWGLRLPLPVARGEPP